MKAFIALCALLLAGGAQAAGLRIAPLRLDLSAAQSSGQVELTNFGAATMAVQVSLVAWSQVDGVDTYVPSKDIFFAPPIVSVPANGKTLVRFRLRAAASKDAERSYRAYFHETSPPQVQNQGGMSFRLKLGVPLFVGPIRPGAPKLQVQIAPADGMLNLTLANPGNSHLKILGMELYPADVARDDPRGAPIASATHSAKGANYLLPGSTHAWSLAVPAGTDLSRSVLLVRTDDYSGKAAPGMTTRGWLWQTPSPGPPASP
ncbi:MAG TPA: fimbria/pilus periplasmic chaperone [Verrucomicrobiae bacterium]|nr:fimbria/pilus periplasmic chaperone [Verrucomicrobiae bacterium]